MTGSPEEILRINKALSHIGFIHGGIPQRIEFYDEWCNFVKRVEESEPIENDIGSVEKESDSEEESNDDVFSDSVEESDDEEEESDDEEEESDEEEVEVEIEPYEHDGVTYSKTADGELYTVEGEQWGYIDDEGDVQELHSILKDSKGNEEEKRDIPPPPPSPSAKKCCEEENINKTPEEVQLGSIAKEMALPPKLSWRLAAGFVRLTEKECAEEEEPIKRGWFDWNKDEQS